MDFDEFTPTGVSRHIVMLLIGIIVLTILVATTINSSYETTVSENGEGLGLPLASGDANTDTSITFVENGNKVMMSGGYVGSVTDKDMILLLSDNKAVYILGGQLHYYNGTSDSVLSTVTVDIHHGTVNSSPFTWVYYPNAEGSYRSYSGSVHYNIDDKVAGLGSYDGHVLISMNENVTSDNVPVPVTTDISETQYGIGSVVYKWSD